MIRALFAAGESPSRSARFHWIAAGVWAAVIFLAIPFARPIQLAVTRSVGRVAFTIVVLAVVCLAGAGAVMSAWRVRPGGRLIRLATLVMVGAAYAYFSLSLRSAPEEALHFVQYGVLALLVFRALSIRIRDVSVYGAALAVAVLVGGLDELVQWLTPERWFGFKDIGLNTLGAALALVGIGLGLQPTYIRVRVDSANIRISLRLWTATCAVLFLFTVNTPWTVEQYTGFITPLQFLRTNPSAMADYGLRHEIGDITFWSRFGLDELRTIDDERGGELGASLVDVRTGPEFADFVADHRRGNDGFGFEAAKRIQVRNSMLAAAAGDDTSRAERSALYAAAVLENSVLESYMPTTLAAAGQKLEPDELRRARAMGGSRPTGESRVSTGLLSAGFHPFAPWILLIVILGLLIADRVLTRRARGFEGAAVRTELAASPTRPLPPASNQIPELGRDREHQRDLAP